ncbi:hypothetical protein GGR00_005560 [Aminobacter aganoensis]|uniref:Uncharacterized protein n=1 Tax=Aminobacter aganoensis TaxID=83264 RepID=A0A7X0KP15_9HYPH|nr:hypothetical protein [Aminobacter aganoensis]
MECTPYCETEKLRDNFVLVIANAAFSEDVDKVFSYSSGGEIVESKQILLDSGASFRRPARHSLWTWSANLSWNGRARVVRS